MSKSMIDVARDTLLKNNHRMAFLDSHFVNLEGNSWDLKTRHTYSESVTDTDEIALDEDDEEMDDASESLEEEE